MQIPVDDFNFISDPTKLRVQGFIAQDLYKYYPEAVTANGDNGLIPLGATSSPWSVDYGRLTPLLAKAIQELNLNLETLATTSATSTPESQSFAVSFFSSLFAHITAWLASADNGIQDLFAKNVYAENVTAQTGTFQTTNASTTNTDKLCVTKSDRTQVCVTGDQLAALLSQSAAANTPISVSSSSTPDLTNSGTGLCT